MLWLWISLGNSVNGSTSECFSIAHIDWFLTIWNFRNEYVHLSSEASSRLGHGKVETLWRILFKCAVRNQYSCMSLIPAFYVMMIFSYNILISFRRFISVLLCEISYHSDSVGWLFISSFFWTHFLDCIYGLYWYALENLCYWYCDVSGQ